MAAKKANASVKPEPAKRGRPATGKRSDPAYRQTLLLLRRDTLAKTAKRLIGPDGERHELSVLVEELLQAWLKK